MAKNPPKQQQEEVEQAPPKRKRGKLILAATLVLLIAGGGAAWFFFSSPARTQAEAAGAPGLSRPVFVNMDAFTVNLHPEVSDQYLQLIASLKVLDEQTSETIKLHMPEIRHRILMLLSSKKASDINTTVGRQRLAQEMRYESNTVLWKAAGIKPPPALEPAKPIGTTDGQAEPPPAANTAEGPTPLREPGPNDPVQEVFFTSFIIQ